MDPNSLTADNFRPLLGFSDLNLATNNGYANYNALQMTWVRTKGRYTINMNYTYGKAMGIVSPALDQYNLANDYGVQAANRTHIFNAAYSVELGNSVNDKRSPAALSMAGSFPASADRKRRQPHRDQRRQNFGMNLNGYKIPGHAHLTIISNVSLLGTNDIQLNPILTCNPASGLGPNQYINPSCFPFPTAIGQNGPSVLPAIYGPASSTPTWGSSRTSRSRSRRSCSSASTGTTS